VLDTLLGPEGSGVMSGLKARCTGQDLCLVRTVQLWPLWGWLGRRRCGWGVRPYVENYTVDASILNSLCMSSF
jgi:hypothetical protein